MLNSILHDRYTCISNSTTITRYPILLAIISWTIILLHFKFNTAQDKHITNCYTDHQIQYNIGQLHSIIEMTTFIIKSVYHPKNVPPVPPR